MDASSQPEVKMTWFRSSAPLTVACWVASKVIPHGSRTFLGIQSTTQDKDIGLDPPDKIVELYFGRLDTLNCSAVEGQEVVVGQLI
mmetsp:Transcript_11816/g.24093  ORF Transcript_11816/g.24093 Transcript_11816/m.24093 type:complete len:86 (-) Transcript_11816:1351-1608(-)